MRKFVFIFTLLLLVTILGLKLYLPEKTSIKMSPKEEMLKKYNAKNTTEVYMKLPYDKKVQLINNLKEKWRADGVIISIPAEEYVKILDEVLAEDPSLIEVPFGILLKEICIKLDDFNKVSSTTQSKGAV